MALQGRRQCRSEGRANAACEKLDKAVGVAGIANAFCEEMDEAVATVDVAGTRAVDAAMLEESVS